MKFIQTDYLNTTTVLKFPDHFVAILVTIDDTGIVADADGKKIVPAGTVIGGNGGKTLSDETLLVNVQNAADAEGVLLNDTDVTYGPASGSMIIHGFVDIGKLPTAPDPAAVTALAGRIVFIA